MKPGLDTHRITQIRALGEDLFAEVVRHFLNDGETGIADMRAAADRDDSRALIAVAHGLEGSAANMGAVALAAACKEIQDRATREDVATLRRWIETAGAEFALAATYLTSVAPGR